jgi:23S rRNA (adenine2030-N6)-methyltransferase
VIKPGSADNRPMLAYRHAFHAGNHADVLKHLILSEVLRHMVDKEKPITMVDTHAGAGAYSLTEGHAQKKAEFEQGISRLWKREDAPPAVARYLKVVRQFNGGGSRKWPDLTRYPGSPMVSQLLLRPEDRLHLYELHPTDHKLLEATMGGSANVRIRKSDGFAGLKGELPPPSRRGLVLIDPPYEIKGDYTAVLHSVREALKRFAQAVILVWVPQVRLIESSQLPQRLLAAATAAPRGWLHARLTVQQAAADGFGLMGSHMFLYNPPFGLAEDLQLALPWLTQQLAQYPGASHELRHYAP